MPRVFSSSCGSGSESPSDSEEQACGEAETEIRSDGPTGVAPQQDAGSSKLVVAMQQNSVSNQPHTKGDGGLDTPHAPHRQRQGDGDERMVHTAGDNADDVDAVGIKSGTSEGVSGGNTAATGDATDMPDGSCKTSVCKYVDKTKNADEDANVDADEDANVDADEDGIAEADEDGIADADEDGIADADEDGIADADEYGIAEADEDGIADADEDAIADADEDAIADVDEDAIADADEDAIADVDEDAIADASALNEIDRVYLGVDILRTLSLQITHKEKNRFLVQQYVHTKGEWRVEASKQQWFQTLSESSSCLLESNHNDKARVNKRKHSITTQHADAHHAEVDQTNTRKGKGVKRERLGEMEAPRHQTRGSRHEDYDTPCDVVRLNNTRRRYGTVVQWYEKKGFGFVSEEACENSIFLHISNVTTGQRSLVPGQLLSYDECFDRRNNKYTAVNASIRSNKAVAVYTSRAQESPRAHVLDSRTADKRCYHDERGRASLAFSPTATPYNPRYEPLADMPWRSAEELMYDRDITHRHPQQENSRDVNPRHEQYNNMKAHGIVCTLLLLILSMHLSVHCSILRFFQFLTTPTKPHCANRTAV